MKSLTKIIKVCKDLKPSKPCTSCWMNNANSALYNNPSSATCYISRSKEEIELCYDNTRVKAYIIKCLQAKYNDKIEYCFLAIQEYFPEYIRIYDTVMLLQ